MAGHSAKAPRGLEGIEVCFSAFPRLLGTEGPMRTSRETENGNLEGLYLTLLAIPWTIHEAGYKSDAKRRFGSESLSAM